ncbi:hypothetical protein [Rhabdothermincola sediminis]|uniref:hypothetical protein n=1 Tax=Rhabdothermincola sediminis TaxID=2751370 RepID=UPI001AA02668|nr:hypothetical protein [Rhabdothermincola sediminis]
MRLRRSLAVAVAAGVLAGGLAASLPASAGAAVTPINVNGVCTGADEASQTILNNFGGSLNVPFQVTPDVPENLPPGDTATVSFTWGLSLTQETIDLLTGLGITSVDVSGLTLPVIAQGSASSPNTIVGNPPDATIPVPPPSPPQVGPFTGQVEGGETDIIYTVGTITLSVTIGAPLNITLNLSCVDPQATVLGTTIVTGVTPSTQPPPTLPPTTTTSTTAQQAAATTSPRFTG